MSGLFGGGAAQSATPQRYNGIQISSSASGGCIPLLYGQQRLPFNLIWYGAFTSTPVSQSSGGKGGGGQGTSSYTYKASFACAICEGPIIGIGTVWNDKDVTSLSALGLTLFTGAGGQATWSYLTSTFPAQAIPYDHICYVGAQNFLLGDSASMPNITFNVSGLLSLTGTSISFTTGLAAGAVAATLTSAVLATGNWLITFSDNETRVAQVVGTAVTWSGGLNVAVTSLGHAGGHLDADPSAFIPDYLSEPNHGVTFPSSQVAPLTGTNSFQSYVKSMSMFLSPCETTQRAAADFLKEIFQICNSDAVWSAGLLKIIPYCDSSVSGNGASFTADLTPIFSFDDDDFLEPPELDRIPIADTFNHVRVEYLDRSNDYNTAIAEASDLGDISVYGERVMDTLSFHEITSSAVARIVAQLALQVSLYERNTITIKVRADYALLEPMDYIAITDVGLGYVNQVFRITEITDSEVDELEIKAMEVTGVSRSTPVYNWAGVQGYNANYAVAPGSVQAPAFLEVYGPLVDAAGGRRLWVSVNGPSGGDISWGGCNVFMSFDGTTYDQITSLQGPGRHGTIATALASGSSAVVPDTTSTIDVQLNDTLAVLGTGSADDALENRMLIAVFGSLGNIEIISYQTATLIGPGHYHLTTLYRGLYGSTQQAHGSGATFMRLDGALLSIPLDPGWLGLTLHFKFTSFNMVGRATEDISTVTDYTYTPSTSQVAYNTVSESAFATLGPSAVVFSPTTAFKMANSAGAWDSSIYSTQSYLNGCVAEWSFSGGPGIAMMAGLTDSPTASPSYTNINYAFYMTGSGNALQIYESGTLVGSFGTYANGDNFQIVFDGSVVSYYQNGNILRTVLLNSSVPAFSMQVAFFSPLASIYGMSFSNMTGAQTVASLFAMSPDVTCVGGVVTPVAGPSNTWGVRNFRSNQAYGNGAQISCSLGVLGNNSEIAFARSPAVGGTVVGQNCLAGFYFATFSSQLFTFYGTGIRVSPAAAPHVGDVFTITYDNFMYRWFVNGALIDMLYQPNEGPICLFGDCLNTQPNGVQLINVSYTPYGQLSPNPFIATGTATTHDSTMQKLVSTGVWDSSVYSLNAYPICHLQAKATNLTGSAMIGLCLNPLLSPSYTNLNYAWYQNAGTWVIYESGVAISAIGAISPTDLVAITYDGANVRYFLNGLVIRGVAVSNQVFFLSSSYLDVSGWGSVDFGPGTVLDTVPTTSLDNNSATTLIETSYSGVVVANSTVGVNTNISVVTVGPFNFDTTIVLTASGQWVEAGIGTHIGTTAWWFSKISSTSGINIAQAKSSYGSASEPGVLALEVSVTLPASTTQTFWLNGVGNGAVGGGWSATGILKAEIIKR